MHNGMSIVFCPLTMLKPSIKQHKLTFVNCSETSCFRAFPHIPTSHEKCAEIFNSRTGHQIKKLRNTAFTLFLSFSFLFKDTFVRYLSAGCPLRKIVSCQRQLINSLRHRDA